VTTGQRCHHSQACTTISPLLYLTIMLNNTLDRTSDELDLVFGALADATRRGIVEQLAAGEATVTELAAPYSISLPAISRHLKVLERASIITRSHEGRWRSSRLSPTSLTAAAAWISLNERLWTERIDRLDHHLARLASEPTETEPEISTQTKRGTP
jgi:DNA-binding transcriptional ArsR family regulator